MNKSKGNPFKQNGKGGDAHKPFNKRNNHGFNRGGPRGGQPRSNPFRGAEEEATPWSHYKEELDRTQDNPTTSTLTAEERRKQEEQARRDQILEKQKEKTTWERFSPEPEKTATSKFGEIKKTDGKFDNRTLTTHQNNKFRQALTKANMVRNVDLKGAIMDLRKSGILKKFKNNKNKK